MNEKVNDKMKSTNKHIGKQEKVRKKKKHNKKKGVEKTERKSP